MKPIAQLHPDSQALINLWSYSTFDSNAFCEILERRWRENSNFIVPTGYAPIERNTPWNYWLELFFLGEGEKANDSDTDIQAHTLANEMLTCFLRVLERIKVPIKVGHLWFQDTMSFRRYSGAKYKKAQALLMDALFKGAATKQPALNAATLNRLYRVYDLATHSLIAEVSNESLTDKLFSLNEKDFPYEAFNSFRDVPNKFHFTHSQCHRWLKNLRAINELYFTRISDLYFSKHGPFYPEKLDIFRKLFDQSAFLIASGTHQNTERSPLDFITELRRYLIANNVPNLLGDWAPFTGGFEDKLGSYWNEYSHKSWVTSLDNPQGSEYLRQIDIENNNFEICMDILDGLIPFRPRSLAV